MKTLKIGSMVSQRSGDKYGVTKILSDKLFFGIWIGNKNFTDRTTYNGYVRNGDFTSDNTLFLRTKNGFRKVHSIGGVLGLINDSKSASVYDLLMD